MHHSNHPELLWRCPPRRSPGQNALPRCPSAPAHAHGQVLGFARVANEQAIDLAGYQRLHIAHLGDVRFFRLANNDPVACFRSYLLNTTNYRGKKRALNIGNNNSNSVCGLIF
jgi:hypothetical protein